LSATLRLGYNGTIVAVARMPAVGIGRGIEGPVDATGQEIARTTAAAAAVANARLELSLGIGLAGLLLLSRP
jgi:hypothetical protein